MRAEIFFGIWPPDFSQFIPEAILTVVTGVAIGFWLWRIQASAEARSERRQAEAMWRLARADFIGTLGGQITGSYPEIMSQFDRFRGVTARHYLIGAWAEASPKNAELQAVTSIVTALPKLQRTGVAFELALEAKVATVVSDPEVRARLHLTSMWVATGRTTQSNEYENMEEDHGDWVRMVLDDPAVVPLRNKHVQALAELVAAHELLRSRLWSDES